MAVFKTRPEVFRMKGSKSIAKSLEMTKQNVFFFDKKHPLDVPLEM